jgi:hypothetical protein
MQTNSVQSTWPARQEWRALLDMGQQVVDLYHKENDGKT